MRNANMRARLLTAALALLLVLAQLPLVSAQTYIGTVNADKVYMRPQASTSSGYIDRLSKGAKVALLDIKGDFYKIRYDGRVGYMMRKFVSVPSGTLSRFKQAIEPQSTSKYAKVNSISALGDPPGNVRYGSRGTDVEKLQRALQLKRVYEGVVDGAFGNKTRDALKAYQQKNRLPVTGLADYATISKLFGRVAQTSVDEDPGMGNIRRIAQIEVPNTTSKGSSGKHVRALQQALKIKGFYKAPIDGSYGNKTVEAVKAYQRSVGLKQDGVAGNGTIRRLFGKNAANHTIKTERLDWFGGGASVIPKGAIFTIKDVSTGRSFTAKRWSGVNHLDAEPLSSKDSDALKSIFGGGWSWARRSILVKYNDHVYAASMNGMPHGEETVIRNGFDGHFCVHFYKSRTHDTNRVDETHQNAVAHAMNATW